MGFFLGWEAGEQPVAVESHRDQVLTCKDSHFRTCLLDGFRSSCCYLCLEGMGQRVCLPWSNQEQCRLTEAYPVLWLSVCTCKPMSPDMYHEGHRNSAIFTQPTDSCFCPWVNLEPSIAVFSTFADLALLPSLVCNLRISHLNSITGFFAFSSRYWPFRFTTSS